MAGLKGNVAWWAIAKQSAKGSAASTVANKIPFSGGSVDVTREVANLSETDASRDQGISYVSRTGVEGSPEAYVRDSYAHTLLTAALGLDTKTGTTNFTHTITPTNDLGYYTIFRNQSDVLYEQFTDCFVSELTIKGEAGTPLTVSANIMGLTPTRSASEPTATSSATVANDSCYNYNDAAVILNGTADATGIVTGTTSSLIRSFELQITNGVNVQQTDDVVPYDVVPGIREINLSFDLILENLDEYNKFFYGSSTGTAASSSIYTTPVNFTFTKGTNNSIAFNIPSLAYEAFPVQPNPNGDPIVVSVRAQAQRTGISTKPIITAVVKNQTA